MRLHPQAACSLEFPTDPLLALFHDPVPQVRQEATVWLAMKEPASRAPVYVALLKDPDPNVQICAFRAFAQESQGNSQNGPAQPVKQSAT